MSVSPIKTVGQGDALNARTLALLRCMIAVSVLLTTWVAPNEPLWLIRLTYLSIAAFCLYSFCVALLSYRLDWASPPEALLWIDVLFVAWIVILTSPSDSSIF